MIKFMPDSSVISDVIASPNFGERRGGKPADMIILHYTGMTDTESALKRLCTAGTDVSAHYVVLEDGRIVQCVQESNRAWHAGQSNWGGDDDINSRSIGIEIVNRGHDWGYPDYPLRQIAAVIALCRGITIRRQIKPHLVLGHSDVSPGRKKDPGEKFPWRALAASGVGHFEEPAPIIQGETLMLGAHGPAVTTLQQSLAAYGYGITVNGHFDATTLDVVGAFQRHFRPERIDGVADQSTLMTLQALLASKPKDAPAQPLTRAPAAPIA